MAMRYFDPTYGDNPTHGRIAAGDDFEKMNERMFEVDMPNKVKVRLGWFPDKSPEGQYRIAVSNPNSPIDTIQYSQNVEEAMQVLAMAVKNNTPLPPAPPERIAVRAKSLLKPFRLLRHGFQQLASSIDSEDVMYFAGLACVAFGVWRIGGDGYGSISAGIMLAFPVIVSILRGRQPPNKGGDK